MAKDDIRILVVDDELISRTIAEGKLLPEGYEIYFAVNGLDAVNKLPQVNPHVILMDVMMPEMNGFEACQKIKSDPQWESVPIIMVTALDDRDTLRRGFEAGANDFVSKAASAIELRARVRSMVRIKLQYDELAQLLKLREDMANMVAHDMRNPLTSIIGYGQLLEMLPMSEKEFQNTAGKIVAESRRLGRFIDDMLLMAKMEENKLRLNLQETDVSHLVNTCIEHLQMSAQAKEITIDVRLAENLTPVLTDLDLFQRVLDNIVSNAIKYSPVGTHVRIEAEPISRNGHTALISVTDEGEGISDEHKDSIFSKFGTGSSDKNVLQIGLGLAFSKMVIDAHHGELSVQDNQPQGSIFQIEV